MEGVEALFDRYQRRAAIYDRYWGPVLAPSARAVLDRVGDRLDPDGAGRVALDVGCGTGVLSVEALRRWPRLRVVALDLAPAMLAEARGRVSRELGRDGLERFSGIEGTVETLPAAFARDLPAADVAVSSFVLQIVPDRATALRAIRSVLRPGGRLAYVTWQDDPEPFAPLDAFDAAVVEADIDEPDEPPDGRSGPLRSPEAAAAQLRRAGFRAVGASGATLEHRWDLQGYLDFKLAYEEEELVKSLDAAAQTRLAEAARRHLAALRPAEFAWRTPVVYAWGDRPG